MGPCVAQQGCCSKETTCNTSLVQAFYENQRLRKMVAKKPKGKQLLRKNKQCLSCCNRGLGYRTSISGRTDGPLPYSLIDILPPGKEGDRAKICCCLLTQNGKFRRFLGIDKKVKREPKNKSQCIHSKTLVKAFHISHRCIRCYKTIKENDIIGICTQCNIQICKKCYINSKKK